MIKTSITIFAILSLGFLCLGESIAAEDDLIKSNTLADPQMEAVRGLIKPSNTATISSQISAQIQTFPYTEGDSFSKGEILVKFDCALHSARFAKSKAEHDASKKNLQNKKRLAALSATSEIDVELAAIEVKKTQADLRAASVMVNRCSIKAPYDGRVIETMANPHESVSQDQELLSILNDKELEIEIIVPSNWLTWLKKDLTFDFLVDEVQKSYQARVAQIGSTVDPVSQTVSIKGIFLEEVDVLAGMSGSARFASSSQ